MVTHFQIITLEKINTEIIYTLSLIEKTRYKSNSKWKTKLIASLKKLIVLSVYLKEFQCYFTNCLDDSYFYYYFNHFLVMVYRNEYCFEKELYEFNDLLEFIIVNKRKF